jgi:flagellar basal-body rod protein FlgF
MPGGVYTALSGLRTQAERLDRLSSDIANSGTSGYKSERITTAVSPRPSFDATLDTAIDVVASNKQSDLRAGDLTPTGRDLDFAIAGPGFFAIQTPGGLRYTRAGHFTRQPDGTVSAPDGSPLMTEDGPFKLPHGTLVVSPDGTFRVGKTTVGRPSVTEFADPDRLIREDGIRFRAPDGLRPTVNSETPIASGVLEQSNILLSERMAQLASVSRGFDSLARGVSVLLNDIDGRAITELSRR